MPWLYEGKEYNPEELDPKKDIRICVSDRKP